MGAKLIILVSMIFCHIVDDYYLQDWLASAKQRYGGNKMHQRNYINMII